MATVSDNFNRTDSSNLGSNWAEDSGDWEIVSNTLRQDTTGDNYRKARWVGTAMDSDDYDSEVDGQSSASGRGFGAFGRGVASATVTFYGFVGFGGDSFYLVEVTGGTETLLDTGSACTASTTFNARVRCNGSTIEGFRNDVSDTSATDSSLTSGSVGAATFADLDGANDFIDNWAAADLAAAGRTTRNTDIRPLGLKVGISRMITSLWFGFHKYCKRILSVEFITLGTKRA